LISLGDLGDARIQKKTTQHDPSGNLSLQAEPTGPTNKGNQSSILAQPVVEMLKTPILVICFLLFFLKLTAFMSEMFFYHMH
jgi:hypothetical protein